MSGTQMFLVIGAILLFAILVLNANRTLLLTEETEVESEYIVMATAAAQNLMNEISIKAFDEGTISFPEYSADILTNKASFGPETGELPAAYDDVDDYHLFTKTDYSPRGGTFNLRVWIDYVNDNNPAVVMSGKSRTKRIKIAAMNQFMNDSLFIYSYKFY